MLEAVFLDVDGTLTSGVSCWQLAHARFGVEEQANEYYRRAMRKEIDYDTWAKLDVALWKGRPYEELVDALLPPNLLPGVKEGVQLFLENGIKVILVSGGIDIFVNAVKEEVGAHEAYSNIVRRENGILNGDIEVHVGTSKAPVVENVLRRFGIPAERTGCIGDHYNDIDMFRLVGLPVAFNPKTRVISRLAKKVVKGDNFLLAAKALGELAGYDW